MATIAILVAIQGAPERLFPRQAHRPSNAPRSTKPSKGNSPTGGCLGIVRKVGIWESFLLHVGRLVVKKYSCVRGGLSSRIGITQGRA